MNAGAYVCIIIAALVGLFLLARLICWPVEKKDRRRGRVGRLTNTEALELEGGNNHDEHQDQWWDDRTRRLAIQHGLRMPPAVYYRE